MTTAPKGPIKLTAANVEGMKLIDRDIKHMVGEADRLEREAEKLVEQARQKREHAAQHAHEFQLELAKEHGVPENHPVMLDTQYMEQGIVMMHVLPPADEFFASLASRLMQMARGCGDPECENCGLPEELRAQEGVFSFEMRGGDDR